jgi:hypothetical protein
MRDVPDVAGDEVVNRTNAQSLREKPIAEMRAEETGAACDNCMLSLRRHQFRPMP